MLITTSGIRTHEAYASGLKSDPFDRSGIVVYVSHRHDCLHNGVSMLFQFFVKIPTYINIRLLEGL